MLGFSAVQNGFSSADAGNLVKGGILLAVGLLFLVPIGSLINGTKRTGADKYLTERRLGQLFLMPIDLVRGRVANVEGSTTARVTEITQGTGAEPSDTRYYYSYRVGATDFEVSEEGYKTLPTWGAQCRVYYLPLSKALLNIEVMDTAPLSVQVPDTVADDIQKPSELASGAQTPDSDAALNARTARAEELITSADSVIRPLANLGARLAFGDSKASEIESRLSHMPRSMTFDLTSSPVYAQALQVAGADSHVLAELGDPIRALPGVAGSTSRKNGAVVTDLEIPIAGPHKRGTLYVTARENAGQCEFHRLEVKVDGKGNLIPLGG
jgi:hypothetical protein